MEPDTRERIEKAMQTAEADYVEANDALSRIMEQSGPMAAQAYLEERDFEDMETLYDVQNKAILQMSVSKLAYDYLQNFLVGEEENN